MSNRVNFDEFLLIIAMNFDDAQRYISNFGYDLREVNRDGIAIAVHEDRRFNRLNVETQTLYDPVRGSFLVIKSIVGFY